MQIVKILSNKKGEVFLLGYTQKQARKVVGRYPSPRFVIGDFGTSHWLMYKWDNRPFSYGSMGGNIPETPEYYELTPEDIGISWKYKDRFNFCNIRGVWYALQPSSGWKRITTPTFTPTGVKFSWEVDNA